MPPLRVEVGSKGVQGRRSLGMSRPERLLKGRQCLAEERLGVDRTTLEVEVYAQASVTYRDIGMSGSKSPFPNCQRPPEQGLRIGMAFLRVEIGSKCAEACGGLEVLRPADFLTDG
jgi:hypothetical protein